MYKIEDYKVFLICQNDDGSHDPSNRGSYVGLGLWHLHLRTSPNRGTKSKIKN